MALGNLCLSRLSALRGSRCSSPGAMSPELQPSRIAAPTHPCGVRAGQAARREHVRGSGSQDMAKTTFLGSWPPKATTKSLRSFRMTPGVGVEVSITISVCPSSVASLALRSRLDEDASVCNSFWRGLDRRTSSILRSRDIITCNEAGLSTRRYDRYTFQQHTSNASTIEVSTVQLVRGYWRVHALIELTRATLRLLKYPFNGFLFLHFSLVSHCARFNQLQTRTPSTKRCERSSLRTHLRVVNGS